jgi:DNA-binding response OmpR family regulator
MDASTGIGLTLAAEYVKLHHGTITVDSELGIGTTFLISMPLGKSHFPVDVIHDGEVISLLARRSIHDGDMPDRNYQFGLVSDKPLILLIDDNSDIISFVQSSLRHKYDFVVADNGEDGLLKATSFLPKVMISDIMMPVMDGLTLCKRVKENPRTSHIGIILLTAKSREAHRVEGIRIGADAYITKPFEIDLLEAHIDHLIQRNKELIDYFRNELIPLPKDGNKNNNEDSKFIKQVMEIIEANITNPEFGVDLISEQIGISSTHLYRKLKALTNNSVKDVIKAYRIKKASLLLQNKEGNVSDVMYDVGFSSLSYFSKCFREAFGVTPKEYQRKMGALPIDIVKEMEGKA